MVKKLLFLSLIFISSLTGFSQNFSFTCPKDTVLGCGVNCFDLVTRFPDLKDLGDNYTVANVSAFTNCYPLVQPGAPGPSTNLLIDDRYSSVIDLPFPFIFYGVTYNSLIASTNGFISFDISKTGQFSHYEDFGNVPTSAYDRALIMGPYHDLDPSVPNSPTQQIKYNVTGVAPNRKWVLSFYKVPLYDCNSLFENTHQIVLNETTGVIEVTIVDKQICITSNNGRAMIGLQDYTRTKGIMPNKRRMTDIPWGSIGMNETYRFTPVGGTSLYKKIELLDAAGTVIATGDTTRISPSQLGWTFPNVCPPSNAPTLYVVKTTFGVLNDPTKVNYSLDTVRVTRNALRFTAAASGTTCGASIGSITVTTTQGTAPFMYSIDGGTPQASNIFNGLAAGTYNVSITDNTGCSNSVNVIISVIGNLTGSVSSSDASCPGVANGSITVTPTTGTAPFTYSANGGPSQASNVFNSLQPGTYNIVFTDAGGCNGTVTTTILPGSNIGGTATSTNTTCPGADNGKIIGTGTGGASPYTYSLNGGPFQTSKIFSGLAPGTYILTIMDSKGCISTVSKAVIDGAGLNISAAVKDAACAGAANGAVTLSPLNGTAPYRYSLNSGPQQTIPTFGGLLPGPYTIIITDGNNCTKTLPVTIGIGTGIAATNSTVQTSCPTSNDGKITVVPTNGSAPYRFSLDGGPVQASGIFINVAPGAHSIVIQDKDNCSGSISTTVAAGPYLSSTTAVINAVCAGINDGRVTITPTGVAPFTFTLTPTNVTQSNPVFTNLGPGAYNYSYKDAIGCTGTGSFVISSNPQIAYSAVKAMPKCAGSSNGSVSFSTAGGLAPYQYALSPFSTYQASGTFTGLVAGTYLFRIKDNAGCTKDTSITLTEPTQLTASATNPVPATCSGNDGSIKIIAGGGTTPYQYSLNGSAFSAANTITAPATGAYPAITVKDANGCVITAATTVTYIDTMRLSLDAGSTVCAGSGITLQPLTNAATSGFTWTSANAPITTLSNPGIKNPVATPVDTSTYLLNAVWGLCSRQASITINVLHKPTVNAGKDTSICFGAQAILNGSAANLSGSVNYSWSPAGSISSPLLPSSAVKPTADGDNVYTLTVKDNYNCNFTVTDAVTVTVYRSVVAFAGNDTIAVKGIPHQLYGSGGLQYLWSPANVLNNPALMNPLATLNGDTRFILEVKDAIGCTDTASVFVKVYDGPTYYIPNAFTPNEDGKNDVFRPTPVGIRSTEWFRVFDRFGHLVFETSEYMKGWDGTYKGQKQSTGTYVWIIKGMDRNGKTVEQKGTVVLIR